MKGIWLSVLVFGLGVAGGAFVPLRDTAAQEQFFTQSGGRGLQNAKTNARLTKTETDVGVIQEDLKTIQPHARAQLGNCANTGEKLKYDGRNWICEKETDPTVKGFAKKDLPSCTGGSILGVSGGDLSCVESGFVSNEADPTVQAYAKAPLPNCGSEQVLSVSNGALACQADQKGLTLETDPKVHNFARKDVVTALPNCGSNELLTMTNGLLSCKVDSVGITVERDPLVQNFARNDIGQPDLAACAAGEVLNATTVDSKVLLSCTSAVAAVSGLIALNDLSDVNSAGAVSGTVLTYSAGEWKALPGLGTAGNPLMLSQLGDVSVATPATDQLLRFDGTRWVNSEDRVASMTDTNWCHVSGGRVVCDRPMPLTCGATEALSWNVSSSTWVCNDLGVSIGQSIALNTLVDVTITTPSVGNALLYDGSGWVNSTLNRILAGDSQVVVTDSGTDGLISFATEGQTHMAITNDGRVGVGVMPAAPYMMDISGATRVAGNLTVTGNLNISGSQSIDGVIFANGGIEMPGVLTSGQVSVTNLSATLADIRTLRAENVSTSGNISANQFIGDGSLLTNLPISTPDWYVLTNIPAQVAQVSNSGAIVMAGISSTNASVTTNLSVGGDLTATSTTLNRLVVDTTGLVRGNLTVGGNLFVSGSQSIDGVVFANGGIEMPGALTSGQISATNLSVTLADIRTLRADTISTSGNISANQFIGDGSRLTGVGVSTYASLTDVSYSITAINAFGPGTIANLNNSSITRTTAFGISALSVSNLTGSNNSAFGANALQYNTSGYSNSSFGRQALIFNTIGYNNTAVGARSGADISGTANNNTIIGASTGLGLVAASNNTIIGANVSGLAADLSNTIIVADGNGNQRIRINALGNTGIGNVSPTTRLDISGTLRLANGGEACDADRTGGIRYNSGVFEFCAGSSWQSLAAVAAAGAQTDRIVSGTDAIVVNGNSDTISFTLAGTTTAYLHPTLGLVANGVSTTGVVSVSTIAMPNTQSSQQGVLLKGNSYFLHNFQHPTGSSAIPVGLNTFLGVEAGNFTMGSTATNAIHGSYNVGIGYRALNAMGRGYSNTGIGHLALTSTTTGGLNTAVGSGALRFNTGGNYNTVFGTNAAYNNASADQNTVIGYNAFYSNTSGQYNSVLGASAGRYVGSGTTENTASNYGVYIGTESRTGFLNSQNEIVIGYNAIGLGSHTVVLGGQLISVTSLRGRVGVAIDTPTTALHVSGTLRLASGGEACDSNRTGGIRYNSGVFEFCSGSAWQSLGDIAAASSDRITSGTTNVYARSDGSISFTTAGTTTGYFYNGQLVANGISTTGTISGSAGYFAGNVGIGTTAPSTSLHLVGGVGGADIMRFTRPDANASWSMRLTSSNFILYDAINNRAVLSLGRSSTPGMLIGSSLANIAGGLDPSTTLHVSGTLRLANGGEACDSNRTGGIRYNSGVFEFCAGSAWQSLAAVASAGATAAGVTGSIQFKGASNEISGTNTLLVTSAANRADVAVSGTVKISGDNTEACSAASDYGQMRFVNVSGVMQMQMCRP